MHGTSNVATLHGTSNVVYVPFRTYTTLLVPCMGKLSRDENLDEKSNFCNFIKKFKMLTDSGNQDAPRMYATKFTKVLPFESFHINST